MHSSSRRNFVRTAALAGIAGLSGQKPVFSGIELPAAAGKWSINARDYGAVGDGVAGDSTAIQRALDAVQLSGGGCVLLPSGVYNLDRPLTIEHDVALLGVYQGPTSHAGVRDKGSAAPTRGTVLTTKIGSGAETGEPLITVGENSTFAGATIYYPDQDPQAVPTPYPWTITMTGNNATVKEVELINPYQGILAVGCARHLIRDVTGQPLRRGIFVDEIYDIGRIENVHWNPWWSESDPVANFQFRNGEAFVFGRSDWEYVFNTFAFGYRYGYRFIRTATGECNGNFLGIGADASWNSVAVDQSAGFGILITNGEFVAMPQAGGTKFPDADTRQVLVQDTNSGVVRFVNCAFWGPSLQNALIKGTGTVGFSDCTFLDSVVENPAIDVLSGCVLVRGCEFRRGGVPVQLGQDVSGGAITGNIIHGAASVVNGSTADLQIGLNSHVD